MLKDKRINNQQITIKRNSVDPGAVEDIYELKYRHIEPKSTPIAGTESQINTTGATSSAPGKRN